MQVVFKIIFVLDNVKMSLSNCTYSR